MKENLFFLKGQIITNGLSDLSLNQELVCARQEILSFVLTIYPPVDYNVLVPCAISSVGRATDS